MRVLFAHGFEGGPSGSKPTYMREELGWEVKSPIMSNLGWSIASQTEVLLRSIDAEEFDLVIGSSMGGLAAANASSKRPDSDFRLILIAPAFGIDRYWGGLSEEEVEEWKISGERIYSGYDLEILLPWEFMESARIMSWPKINHLTSIMHGTHDDVVDIDFSRKMAVENSLVDLYEFDDNHRMKESIGSIGVIVSDLMTR